jgi:MATE family multidrug resistance protein
MSGQAAAAAPATGAARHPIRSDIAQLARLAGPVAAGRIGVMTMGLTDAVVVGRYSAVQLGYHALAWALAATAMSLGLGLLSGIQVMASRALGEGRPAEAGAVLRRGLSYGLWLGLATAAVLVTLGPLVLRGLGLKGDLAAGATGPLIVFAVSMPGFTVSLATASWLEGLGRPTPPNALMWAANVLNLGVDLVLVPGTMGLPAMGAVGAAVATLTARIFLSVATLVYIARMADARALGVFDRPRRDRPREIEQRRVGYGAGASSLFEAGAFSSMNVFAGWIGPLAVAGWAVVLNVAAFVFMVPWGIATATAVMVARARGAGDEGGMRRAALVGFAAATLFGCVVALALWPNVRAIAMVYTSQPAAVTLAAGGLTIACIFLAPDALQVVVAQSLRARGDVLVPTLTHLTSYIAVMMPLAYVLAIGLGQGLAGIVWACVVASFVSATLLLGRFWMLARR